MSLVLYPTKEDYAQINALVEKGQTGIFDTSHPINIIPTRISGPAPGDNKSIKVMLHFRDSQGRTGAIDLTYWTPILVLETGLSSTQQDSILQYDQQMHDMSCRGIP
jgi:hypothetical protein